jgi:FkbM family methyltransferase
MMERYIPPGGTVVDGGAHIGYHTLLAARLVGPSGRVISFEPAPATYALLAENVARNGYQNVTLVNGALSDRSGPGTLLLNSSWSGDHRIGDVQNRATTQKPANCEAIPIDLYSLDEFLGEQQSVDFIKLDVQGAEPLVFRGAGAMLKKNSGLVVATEYDPVALPPSLDEEAFLDELFSRFTTVLDVNDETKSICSATVPALLASYTRENERHTNLVCMNRGGCV